MNCAYRQLIDRRCGFYKGVKSLLNMHRESELWATIYSSCHPGAGHPFSPPPLSGHPSGIGAYFGRMYLFSQRTTVQFRSHRPNMTQ